MKTLYLRTCAGDFTSYGGFQWPREVGAEVIAPDWSSEPKCGGGLHGLPWGEGDGWFLSTAVDPVFMVVEADAATAVDLGGKHKFPRCVLRHIGDRESAPAFILANGGAGKACAFARVTVGNWQTAIVGDCGTAVAGECGNAIAGQCGAAVVWNYGIATVGHYGSAAAGYGGELRIQFFDGERMRTTIAYVGENGIEPNVAYTCVRGEIKRAEIKEETK